MKISCLMVSHNKPEFCTDAIQSVQAQSHDDWELLVMDSGLLWAEGYFKHTDARIKVIPSGETKEMKERFAMAPWCFNEFFRRNLPTGDLIVYLCDDDIFYEGAFALYSRWATNNPNILAMYGSIDLAVIPLNQPPVIYGQRKALEIGGSGAYQMDCRVDYLQFCHRKEVLDHMAERWPEGKETERHADGVFMDRVGKICHIYPIPVKVGQNRRTTKSTYYPL